MMRAEERTANHEIISAFVVALGMFGLAMDQKLGVIVILAGAGSLALIYGYRTIARREERIADYRAHWINRINYIGLIAGLVLMASLLLSTHHRLVLVSAGTALMAGLALLNLGICRLFYYKESMLYCYLRIALVIMLLMLFYYFPVR